MGDARKGDLGVKQRESMVAYLLWFILKARNDWVYHHQEPRPKQAVDRAVEAISEFFNQGEKTEALNRGGSDVWQQPPYCWHKINCDGAFLERTKQGSIGVAVRDTEGTLIHGETDSL
ncbi:unnamed protein product [Ilex paraguariensis]|uniref:RNase H type-1 domain-containing protein n=1 Tax=Ilex paraguariensis TaxID=185542 RepID=A0ABC8SA96_9AQUA